MIFYHNLPLFYYLDCYNNCLNDSDDDGVCDEIEVLGCEDATSCTYNPDATDSCDDCCEYPEEYYDCDGCIIDTDNDGVCDELEIDGCMDGAACNYDPDASIDDGSCDYGEYCWDGSQRCDCDE